MRGEITVGELRDYLAQYEEVLAEIEENDELEHDLLCNAESDFEYIADADFCGWDFSKYPVYKMFDNGSCEFFAGIVALPAAKGDLDRCPIYMFDLSESKEAPRFVGGFKTYMRLLYTAYVAHPDSELKKEAKKALKKLDTDFPNEVIMPDAPLTCADFGFK